MSRLKATATIPCPIDLFWRDVTIGAPDACWEWQGKRKALGYGRCDRQGVLPESGAHRVAYALLNGPIPSGLDILHKCDNPPCVNPVHLYPGTDADNKHDSVSRGRHAFGTRQGSARLYPQAVIQIRASNGSVSGLARRYGVSRRAIQRVLKGRTWKQVTAHSR